MAAQIPGDDREFMIGETRAGEWVRWSPEFGQDAADEGPCLIVPVIARPNVYLGKRRELPVDRSAQVVTGDVTEEMTLSPFERTERDYQGHGAFSGFDESPPELFDNPWEL